ncbi:hypothetical protein F7Q99_32795 [Streptomyces kaniharaensis]|uniref:DUF3060 domain-containing protein n=1 Tax=Streptomyces kaniharaensis TaxID=212423 RepID=A0A6N7L2C3_9ACTN|nr:hypothetical protein [Streptomyces kaniharaensis]MQS16839.1 hypothetical protein [Streptomyces kaniharaensis]
MKIAVLGAVLAIPPLLVAAAAPADSAHTRSARPTIDATCVQTAHGTFATAVDPGATNTSQPDTLRMTGKVECVDSANARLASGTFERTVTMPGVECTGEEHRDTSTTTVHWSDGAVSTLDFDRTEVVKASGTASLVITGSVTADSARFARDTIKAVGISSGSGCGTRAGETAVDSTLVLHLTH